MDEQEIVDEQGIGTPENRDWLAADTPDVAGPESAIGIVPSYDSDIDAAFDGDDALTPGPIEDLDDAEIADTVGPGALAQPLGRIAAGEAITDAAPGRAPLPGEPVDPEVAALDQDINVLSRDERALVGTENGEQEWGSEPPGNYYGDLLTGQVEDGPLTSEDRRIGPFATVAEARAALATARVDYGGGPPSLE